MSMLVGLSGNKKREINTPLIPPDGARDTGERVTVWDESDERFLEKIVYRRKLERPIRSLVRDADGRMVFQRLANGEQSNTPKTEITGWEPYEEEFLLEDGGNGMVRLAFHFRPDPTEAARQAEQANRETFVSDLYRELRQSGVSIADVVAVAKELRSEPSAAFPYAGTDSAAQPDIEQLLDSFALGGSWFELPNKERIQGRDKARDRLKALAATTT